ncbi:uncharacterized protein LOC6557918 [Drosophila grimshawi]|uniref:GH15693 n=1 Tax=Drosophila grimshawi TaxID=7222 RepID=B4IZ72_DROGR|nr:uncharacterized protein LOC6557918 [Drosophila grimshawi]EDV95594.1 GH15693 [Drosophila grimshawi]EDW04919.1 GH24991 [Drosophila grimshawi]
MAATTSSSSSARTGYALFLHRAELQRRCTHFAKVSQTKIQLTGQLIARVKQRMATCSYEDLQIMVREQEFKRRLEKKLKHRAKQLQILQKQAGKLKRLQ